jgi:hypothetical protein
VLLKNTDGERGGGVEVVVEVWAWLAKVADLVSPMGVLCMRTLASDHELLWLAWHGMAWQRQ